MQFLNGVLSILTHIIILISVIIYISKRPSPEGTFMMVGASVNLLTSAFYSIVLPLLLQGNQYDNIQSYIATIGLINIFGALSFAVGFLMLIRKIIPVSAKPE